MFPRLMPLKSNVWNNLVSSDILPVQLIFDERVLITVFLKFY